MKELPVTPSARILQLLYATILNFEILAAVLLWPSHRGLAWWMIVSAATTFIGSLVPQEKKP